MAIIGEILYFIINYNKFKSFLEMTKSFLAQIKVHKIISRRELTEPLLDKIDLIFPLSKKSQLDHQVNSYYKRVVFGVMLPLTVFTMGAVLTVVSMPVIKSLIEWQENGYFEKRLPFLIWYPFNVDSMCWCFFIRAMLASLQP